MFPPFNSKKYLQEMAAKNYMTVPALRARLVEEGLRREGFRLVDFRDSALGRQAYVKGSSLAVWEILLLARSYEEDFSSVAKHLRWSEVKAESGYVYAQVFPEEVSRALAKHDATDFKKLSKIYPGIQGMTLDTKRSGKGGKLHLLLDELISPVVLEELRLRVARATVETLMAVGEGMFQDVSCGDLLAFVAQEKIIFVTYDRSAMAATLHNWRETGYPHGGVIVIDDKTVPPSDIQGLVGLLQKLVELSVNWDWANRVVYLHR